MGAGGRVRSGPMSLPFEYAVAVEAEMPAMARMIHHAFGFPTESCETWLRKSPVSDLRVARVAGEPAACLRLVPMGQYFGGRAVPMTGIAGVATAPERRGQGLARRMMEACVEELAAAGVAMSTLYPSTRSLYRKVGYEEAGRYFSVRVPVSGLGEGRAELIVRPLTPGDEGAVRQVYDRWAAGHAGALARGDYVWNRVKEKPGQVYDGFGMFATSGQMEGYVYLHQARKPDALKHDVLLSDVAWTSPRAGRTLMNFLAGFGTMGSEIEVLGSPCHPLLSMAPGVGRRIGRCELWMVRLTDVRAALSARGYPAGLKAAVVLDVHDELIPSNDGVWTLEVEDGRAGLKQGGEPSAALRLGVRALAAIFTGHLRASQAALMGWAHAEQAETLMAADAVFGGGEP